MSIIEYKGTISKMNVNQNCVDCFVVKAYYDLETWMQWIKKQAWKMQAHWHLNLHV